MADGTTRMKIPELTAIPRKPGGLNLAMKLRKLHWEIPSTWIHREEEDIEAKLISTHKSELREVVDGFRRGTLKAVRHP